MLIGTFDSSCDIRVAVTTISWMVDPFDWASSAWAPVPDNIPAITALTVSVQRLRAMLLIGAIPPSEPHF
jgi:hypothetical protein